MRDQHNLVAGPPRDEERPSASLLVRCWLEPGDTADREPVVRGYVRDLKTGEERFIKDVSTVGDQILRRLHAAETPRSDVLERGDALG